MQKKQQRELLRILANHFFLRPQYFRTLIGVQFLLDICRDYYWFQPEEKSLGLDVSSPEESEILHKDKKEKKE
jgi:hypothetical protein